MSALQLHGPQTQLTYCYMVKICRFGFTWSLVFFLNITSLPAAKAFEALEGNLEYPATMGYMGQNFHSNLGGNVVAYLGRFIDPKIANFLSIGYESFGLRSDQNSTFRLIPIIGGVELAGKFSEDFNITLGAGLGLALGYLSVSNQSTFNMNYYFLGQVKPGIEYLMTPELSLVLRSPFHFLAGKTTMSYVAFHLGVKFKLGDDEPKANPRQPQRTQY